MLEQLDLNKSYFSNRKLLVCIKNVLFEVGALKYCVPPESFLLYINDISQSTSETGSYLYKGETTSLVKFSTVSLKKIEDVLNKRFCCQLILEKLKPRVFSSLCVLKEINIYNLRGRLSNTTQQSWFLT